MANTVVIKVNTAMNGVKKGARVRVKTGASGIPLDRFWRNRFRDAAIGYAASKDNKGDGCIELYEKNAGQANMRVHDIEPSVEPMITKKRKKGKEGR